MSTINLSNILSELRSPAEMHKTAADKSCASSDTSSKDEPKAEEKNNDNSDNSENKGSDSEEKPSESLDKIASELAAMEHNTMIKEAQIFGSTMADSFATRMTEIQQVLDQEDTMNKTASYDQNDMEKIAADLYNNMDAESEQAVEGLVKVAAEEGINLSREEAFQALAQEAAEAGQNAAMEKVASAEMYDTLDQAERASLQGFTKTAQAMGHDFDVLDSLTYLRNTELEKTAAKKEDDSTALGTGLGAGAGLAGGAGGAAALAGKEDTKRAGNALKTILGRKQAQSAKDVQKYVLKDILKRNALKGGGALAGGLALGAGAGHLIDKYAADNSLDGELAEMEKMAADLTASGEMEKVAELENIAYELGFEDTLTKVASHVSGIGYEQTNNLLQNL